MQVLTRRWLQGQASADVEPRRITERSLVLASVLVRRRQRLRHVNDLVVDGHLACQEHKYTTRNGFFRLGVRECLCRQFVFREDDEEEADDDVVAE